MDTSWALVTAVTPEVQVRFPGDTADVTVALKNSGLTLATNDKVAMDRRGSQWVVAYVLGAA